MATNIVRKATLKDVIVALTHRGVSIYSLYQRKDQFWGGNSRYWESEKDIGITITVGIIKRHIIIDERK